ncbi:MAG: efflux RND transporter permease subunit [Endomicrobium sp.]|jgi:HAE1 family hydrophobic/amphiphilic exporter-1|nr:efflux RND transporter permease subunit [Endomicrobium sp.]
MNLAKLAIKRPTFVSALLVSILILGFICLSKLDVRMFPDVEYPYVLIRTFYPGAGITDIEKLVTKPIEDALSGISGLKHSGSINQDNLSIVYGEFELSKNPDIAAQEVRDKVEQIRVNLPENIKGPTIIKVDLNSLPLITLSLKSKSMKSKELFDFADDIVSKDLSQVSGVSQVQVMGGIKEELHVNANKRKLKEHGITLAMLADRILSNGLDIPAGRINKGYEEITFRTIGEFRSIGQINDIVVNFSGNDRAVTVKDVAKVEYGIGEEDSRSRSRLGIKENGKITCEHSILLSVCKQTKGNDITISDRVREKISKLNEKYRMYEGEPKLTVISDSTIGIKRNINNVKSTILEGIFLAVIVVYLFLGSWRSTFITALALPNSLIGAFIFMYIFGFSLNVVSLMSLSLTVGLLIDDAIVVRENIFRHYEQGVSPVRAAIDGTKEVTLAVVATTSTVIAVFLPLAFLSGIMGQFFKEFGLTVVFAMVISIIDALTIAPMLSAYIIPDHNDDKIFVECKVQRILKSVIAIFRMFTVDWFNKIFSFIEMSYRKLISFIVNGKFVNIPIKFLKRDKKYFTISWKFITLTISMFIFLGMIVVAKGYLKTTFMPTSEWGEFNVTIVGKPGTSLDTMDKYSKQIEKIIINDPNVELISSTIGSGGDMVTNLSNQTNIYVKMVSGKSQGGFIEKVKELLNKRKNVSIAKSKMRTTSEMKDYLRKVLSKKFSGELEFSISKSSIGSGSSEFIMELTSSEDTNVLYDAVNTLIERYKKIPYFVDVHSNCKIGKPEIQIKMDSQKMRDLGVCSTIDVGGEIRAMINGVVLFGRKYKRDAFEHDIRVKLEDDQKDILKNFNDMYVRNINNKLIKLKDIALIEETSNPDKVYRKDRSRFVTIEGNVAAGGTIGEIQKEVMRIFNEEKTNTKNFEKWKNISYELSGNVEDMKDMFKSIFIASVASIIFIFIVLASLYESIVTPFTIMTALPLAIIGGIIALVLFKQPIDMFTMIGMIMLLGIVAKNSILLVDCIQQQMRNGLSMNESIIKAGSVRLRPILMTSFALIAGMLPTALGFSEVGKFRRGMGIVVIGGVISSTILTLIVVPAIFGYMDKFRCLLRKLIGRPDKRMVDYLDEQLKEKGLE